MANERLTFVLSCTECKNKNYYFAKGKKKDYKVELNKFCKKCGKHQAAPACGKDVRKG